MEPSTDSDSELVISEWETFFTEISRFISSLNNQRSLANEQFSEYAVERLEMFILNLLSLISHLSASGNLPNNGERNVEVALADMCTDLTGLSECLRSILTEWEDYLNHPFSDGIHSYSAPISTPLGSGRPRFDISHQQLFYLRSMSFSWVQIANLLGVSRMTIFWRRTEFGMTETLDAERINDDELELIIRQIKRNFPSLGQTMVWGRVRSMGYHVSRGESKRDRQNH